MGFPPLKIYEQVLKRANELTPELIANRRYLHQHPELGKELFETSRFIREKLEEMGYEVRSVGGCGLVALAGGKKVGKCILLRSDMDALPITEETGLSFASENPGVMHACGHDFHMAMLLGAARILKEHEEEIEGTVKFCFQPDEEGLSGANDMISDGLLEDPTVDAAFAMHVRSGTDVPVVDYSSGWSMSSDDSFTIHVFGTGCHGSAPHKGVSAINIGTHIYLGLQELVSREVNPAEQCSLTIGSMLFGSGADNVLPGDGILRGTIRGYNREVTERLRQRVEELAEGTAQVFGGNANVTWDYAAPAMYCNPDLTEDILSYTENVVGTENIVRKPFRETGSEDFAYIAQKVPSHIFWLGCGVEKQSLRTSIHTSKVLFNEDALPYGAAIHAQCAIEWLKEHS